ncbi:hypothetical protein [Legionella parisiensis]|uniref:Uncharacterized protein n=1 Tax=Legionella parisiensis TaxID=45071 RepID=A0A1E5JUB2_9GAMM|nr:hypothetical protein [Legionella parisiensis]KTD44038.1 hypothetical protein Lpar_0513 [Legionella parisiensis]OEH48116.1 hypothetical protein lpari_00871 [Legionella parisiensis]STX76235.1 Uncharacterised protein [Legionella parisiensis]
MMSKETNGTKSPGDATKKWSFLDTSKRILDEEKSIKNSLEKKAIKEEEKTITSSDNLVEAEPDISQLFKPKW